MALSKCNYVLVSPDGLTDSVRFDICFQEMACEIAK